MENYQDMTKVSEWQRPSSTEDEVEGHDQTDRGKYSQ